MAKHNPHKDNFRVAHYWVNNRDGARMAASLGGRSLNMLTKICPILTTHLPLVDIGEWVPLLVCMYKKQYAYHWYFQCRLPTFFWQRNQRTTPWSVMLYLCKIWSSPKNLSLFLAPNKWSFFPMEHNLFVQGLLRDCTVQRGFCIH